MSRARVAVAVALAVSGCDAAFGLHDPSPGDGDGGPQDGRADDARLDDGGGPDAPGDAFVDPPAPACWAMYQPIGTLPAARYALSQQSYSWADARTLCRNVGAHLLVVSHNDSEQVQVFGAFLSTFWAGLTDTAVEGTWASETGEPVVVPSGLSNKTAWADGEPGAAVDNQDCARNQVNLGANLGLYDASCAALDHALCECELPVSCPARTGAYSLSVAAGSWDEASDACAAEGLQIAAFGSAEEMRTAQLALTQFPGVAGVWIDARDALTEGDWRAASGCRPYLRWAMTTTPEPGGGLGENCAQLTAAGVIDAACAGSFPALCQAP